MNISTKSLHVHTECIYKIYFGCFHTVSVFAEHCLLQNLGATHYNVSEPRCEDSKTGLNLTSVCVWMSRQSLKVWATVLTYNRTSPPSFFPVLPLSKWSCSVDEKQNPVKVCVCSATSWCECVWLNECEAVGVTFPWINGGLENIQAGMNLPGVIKRRFQEQKVTLFSLFVHRYWR